MRQALHFPCLPYPPRFNPGVFRPTRLLLSWCLAAFVLVLVSPVRGQEAKPKPEDSPQNLSARDAVPPKPASGLLDEGNVFTGEDLVLASADREDFQHRVQLPLFVVTANYIFGESVDQYGQRLLREWLKDQPGVVLLYERGSRQLNFSATPGALGSNDDLQALFLSGSRAGAMMPEESTAAQRLRAVIQALATSGETFRKTGKIAGPEKPADPPAPPEKPGPEAQPAPPVDFMIDDADAFDLEAEAALKTELVKFHSRHDMDIYVLTYSILPHASAQLHAEAMAAAWLKDRLGVVIVYNRGTAVEEEPLGIAGSHRNEEALTPVVLFTATAAAREKAKSIQSDPQGSLAAALRAATDILLNTFATRGAAARTGNTLAPGQGQRNTFTGMAAALVIGTLLLYLFHRLQERLENRANEQFFFPDVTVDRRLGSPQGGGQVSGITFQEKP